MPTLAPASRMRNAQVSWLATTTTAAQVSYPVTHIGYYWIEAAGAQGGQSNPLLPSGRGAILNGKFRLEEGDAVNIPVSTLAEWSIALLAALVAGFGLRLQRRKQRA